MEKQQIDQIIIKLTQALSKAGINYLVYGSYAYVTYTLDQSITPADVDIIVSEKDFTKIVEIINNDIPELNPILTEFAIHANHRELTGSDGKPFDISLDSYERYFEKLDIQFANSYDMDVEGELVSFISKEDLAKVYEYALSQSNTEKFEEYNRKLNNLKQDAK